MTLRESSAQEGLLNAALQPYWHFHKTSAHCLPFHLHREQNSAPDPPQPPLPPTPPKAQWDLTSADVSALTFPASSLVTGSVLAGRMIPHRTVIPTSETRMFYMAD